MSYKKNTIKLVGYWNGDEENPDIVFTPPDNELKRKKYSLVMLEITEPFENDISDKTKQIEKKIGYLSSNKANKKLNEANNNLKKLSRIMRRFK